MPKNNDHTCETIYTYIHSYKVSYTYLIKSGNNLCSNSQLLFWILALKKYFEILKQFKGIKFYRILIKLKKLKIIKILYNFN